MNDTYKIVEQITAEDLTKAFNNDVLPVTIFVSLQIVLGITGNILILIVYYKWYKVCNFRSFVLSMACIDLLSSMITLPGEVYSHRNWYNYDNNTICKAKSFFNVFTVWASGLLLLFLAYDRNRKICCPLSWQIQNHTAKLLCIVSVLFSVVISLPTAVLWGIQNYEYVVNNEMVMVSICEKDNAYADGNIPFLFMLFALVVPMTLVVLVTVVLNVCTGRKLLLEIRHNGTDNMMNGCSLINSLSEEETCQISSFENTSESDETLLKRKPLRRYSFPTSRQTLRRGFIDKNRNGTHHIMLHTLNNIPEIDSEMGAFSSIETFHFLTRFVPKKHHSQSDADVRIPSRAKQLESWKRRIMRHKLRSRKRKTMIMLTLSTVFIITTTIYLALVIIVARNAGVLQTMSNSDKVIFFLFWRLYFINSLINPVLYGIMDLRFRKGVVKLFQFKLNAYKSKTFL